MNIETIKRLCPEFNWVFDRFETIHKTNALEILKALAEARQALEWRPISEAPTDRGKIILLGSPEAVTETGWRSRNEPELFENEYGFIRPQPTHWMPLPTPPSVQEGA